MPLAMKAQTLVPVLTVVLLLGLAGLTGCTTTPTAKLSRADAQAITLAKVPGGTVKEGELEKEHGRLVWSFDITTPGTVDVIEVQVDAQTGEVVSQEIETPAAEQKESAAKHK